LTRPARVVVDLEAAQANLERVRQAAPGRRVMAIIKADAYGHGLVGMAQALAGAEAFGVACLEEALVLRDAGIRHPIVLLEGPFSSQEVHEIRRLDLDTVIHAEEQVRMLDALPDGRPLRLWIKLDTGMHRLGFPAEGFRTLLRRLVLHRAVARPLRIMSHLASAHEPGHASVAVQLGVFNAVTQGAVTQGIAGERSMANSAALLAWPETQLDWVRPGLMLYGVSPFAHGRGPRLAARDVPGVGADRGAARSGRRVGRLWRSWRCPEEMPVGVVAIGYGDGYPRHAASGTPVLVAGRRAALIGKASMDMLTVACAPAPKRAWASRWSCGARACRSRKWRAAPTPSPTNSYARCGAECVSMTKWLARTNSFIH
jgi:alanine racemase